MSGMGGAQTGELASAVRTLRAVASRASIGLGLRHTPEERLLQATVDATVELFDADAASIALFERDPDRLEYVVAGGEQGKTMLGQSIGPTEGLAGHVFTTGQALAVADVARDPRFERERVELGGYVPTSAATMPLYDEDGTVGILQVLDKRGAEGFSLRDMELLAIFATQATAAIRAAQVERDLSRLLRVVLRAFASDELDDSQLEVLVSAATEGLDSEADAPFWTLVEQLERVRRTGERQTALAARVLHAIADDARTVGTQR